MKFVDVRKHWLLITVLLVIFPALLVRYLDRVPQRNYCDFRVYYKAGGDFIKGKNIYFREKEEITPYKYSPFFAFVFAPLTLLPIKASAAAFFGINFLSSILFFWLSFRLVQDFFIGVVFSFWRKFLIYALVFLCTIQYVFLVWDSGQVNFLMCALVLAGMVSLSKDQDVLAGAFFAASVLIKYTPALFLPYFIFKRKFKLVFWIIIFSVVFLMLPALAVGFKKNLFYLVSWIPSIISTSLDHFSYYIAKNQSIYSMFLRFLTPTYYRAQFFSFEFDHVMIVGRLAALAMYVVIFIPGKSKQSDRVIDFAALMVCMSLFNPNGWLLNFVSLALGYMVLIQYLITIKWKDVFLTSCFVMAVVLSTVVSRDILGKTVENISFIYSFFTIGALIIYVALLRLKFVDRNF